VEVVENNIQIYTILSANVKEHHFFKKDLDNNYNSIEFIFIGMGIKIRRTL